MFFHSTIPLEEFFENPIPLEMTELILLGMQGAGLLACLVTFVIYIAKRKKKFELTPLDHLEHDFNLAPSPLLFLLFLVIPFRNVVHFELTLFDETFRYGVTPADLIAFLFGYREEGIDELMEMLDVSSVELISELPGKLQFAFFAPLVLLIILFIFVIISMNMNGSVGSSHFRKKELEKLVQLRSSKKFKKEMQILGIFSVVTGAILVALILIDMILMGYSLNIHSFINYLEKEDTGAGFIEVFSFFLPIIAGIMILIRFSRPTKTFQLKLNEHYATPADACKALRRATFLSYGAFCGYCLFSVILCAVARNYIEEEMGGWLGVTVGNELLLPFLLATLYTVLFILGSSSTKPLLDRLFSRPEPAPAIVPQISPRLAEQANVALLQEYKKLLDSGVITEEEFQKKKDEILNR